jgi:hypothetical protein
VSLDLARGGEVFGSTSVVRFGCAQTGAPTYAELIAENVREITLNGAALDPAAGLGRQQALHDPDRSFEFLLTEAALRYRPAPRRRSPPSPAAAAPPSPARHSPPSPATWPPSSPWRRSRSA